MASNKVFFRGSIENLDIVEWLGYTCHCFVDLMIYPLEFNIDVKGDTCLILG